MTGYGLLLPEYLILAAALWGMFADILPGKDRGATVVGAGLAGVAAVLAAITPLGSLVFGGLLVFDGTARFIRVAAAILFALWVLWAGARVAGRLREAVTLAALSTLGSMLLAASTDLIMILVALELSTMPAYALIGQRSQKVTSLEGAMKFFLLSMMTTLVTMYGFSFLYGISQTTVLADLSVQGAGSLGVFAVLFTLVGILAKLSAAPFHYWAPDAYAGAGAGAVAFVSVIPKLGGAVILVRLVQALAPSTPGLGWVVAISAAASMLLGNLAALQQDDVRRLMAYSGVSHAGFLMLGVAALSPLGYRAALFYAVAYSIPSMGIMMIAGTTGPTLQQMGGLGRRAPLLAWSGVIMLLSLVGIPPMIGFFGKLYLFIPALDAGLQIFVALAVLMSAMSAYYYFRIIRSMFFIDGTDRTTDDEPIRDSKIADWLVVAMAAISVGLGLASGLLLATLGG